MRCLLNLRGFLLGAAALGVYWLLVRPWQLRWRATDDEVSTSLPGDELLNEPNFSSTRAITIDAPAADVWPWLVQLGQHRAGFYTYTCLENILLTGMRNADRIVPEWQHLEVGDLVWLHPKVSLRVAAIDPGRSLVLEDDWAFVLRPIDERSCRLIVRSRGTFTMPDFSNTLLNFLYWRLIFEPAHFIMERRMLLGIKRRAEGGSSLGAPVAGP